LLEVEGQGRKIVYVYELGWCGVAVEESFKQHAQVEPLMPWVIHQAVVEVKSIH
jgi:hypothetical protein